MSFSLPRRSALLSLALLILAAPAWAATAELQVIHNAPDPAAEVVDIYVGDDLFVPDFAFRTATPFVDVPANTPLTIGVAPGDSESADDVIATFDVKFERRNRYVVVANGVLDPAGFAANPEGRPIGFSFYTADHIRTRAWFGFVRLLAAHGSPDAPTVDIRARGIHRPLVGDLGYGDFAGQIFVWGRPYTLDITPAGAPETVVASYEADLTGLRGGSAVVFASGFLDPAANGDGPAFGLYAALPNGDVVALPPVSQTARLQVIHNAADKLAAQVDVYVNGDLFLPDFAFRTATPFVDVPAGVDLEIAVAPGDSESAEDAVGTFTVNLEVGGTYVAIANGVLGSGFTANPSGRDIGFTLFTRDGIREEGRFGLVRVLGFHGATDAPAVDILAKRGWWRSKLFGGLEYGDFSDYRWLRARKYLLQVTPAGDRSTVVAQFEADLRGLGNGAAVVFASGFLDPAANDGPGFGLFAALPSGDVVALGAVGGGSDDDSDKAPRLATGLDQNAPNPFNPMTTISFSMATPGAVQLAVYDQRGRLVETLVEESLAAGSHRVPFDGRGLASGVYYYRLKTADQVLTKRMTLVK